MKEAIPHDSCSAISADTPHRSSGVVEDVMGAVTTTRSRDPGSLIP